MSKNKYQEALGRVSVCEWETRIKDRKILQELVDKETPMKPVVKIGGIERCGKCKYQFDPNNDYYCSQCGQCRDWSDE